MTGPASFLLSIMMIAAFLLGAGGETGTWFTKG